MKKVFYIGLLLSLAITCLIYISLNIDGFAEENINEFIFLYKDDNCSHCEMVLPELNQWIEKTKGVYTYTDDKGKKDETKTVKITKYEKTSLLGKVFIEKYNKLVEEEAKKKKISDTKEIDKNKINSFPTFLLLKKDGSSEKYEGDRSVAGYIDFLNEKALKIKPK